MEIKALPETQEFEMILINKETKEEFRLNLTKLEMSRKIIRFYNYGDSECKEMMGLPWSVSAEAIELDFNERFSQAQSKYDFYEPLGIFKNRVPSDSSDLR